MAKYTKTTWDAGRLITKNDMEKIEEQLKLITPGATNVAEDYKFFENYSKGDYCLYDGELWKCIAIPIGTDEEKKPKDSSAYWTKTKVMNETNLIKDDIEENYCKTDTIAPTFSESDTYAAGDYVYYDGALYRFTADHAAGAWVGTDAKTVGIGEDVAGLKSALLDEDIIRAEYHSTSVIMNSTIYSDGVIVGGAIGDNVYVFNVFAGDTVLVTGGTVYGYYSTEPEKNGIPSTDGTRHIATLDRTLITMPSGANYLAVRHTVEPTVLDGSKTTTDRVDAIEAVMQNAPVVKSITVQQFSQAPYNNTIGNLDRNTIVNITPSYNAVDYPYGDSTYYTIITAGESSSYIQIAIRIDGRAFTRKRGSSGWYAWTTEALESSNLQLAGPSPTYTDFNDFPVGSILSVNALELTNGPEGYANTGHDALDTGVISAVVMTFATKHDNPTLKAQLCLYYRNATQGTPRMAYRTALLYEGSYLWTNWSMYSEDGAIHATNKIIDINHLDYTFDDFDDAPINTVYQVDLNVADAVAHNPAPGKSGSLLTYGFSNSSRHSLTQIYIALDSGVPKLFFRYGVIQSADVYAWTAWYQVNATMLA